MNTYTYALYLGEPASLPFEKMQTIHQSILNEIGGNVDAEEIYEEFIAAAVNYAAIRTSWCTLNREEKVAHDAQRTARHNAVISRLNVLTRYLRMNNKNAAWRDELGDESQDNIFRKTIGDFACYIAFVNALYAR